MIGRGTPGEHWVHRGASFEGVSFLESFKGQPEKPFVFKGYDGGVRFEPHGLLSDDPKISRNLAFPQPIQEQIPHSLWWDVDGHRLLVAYLSSPNDLDEFR